MFSNKEKAFLLFILALGLLGCGAPPESPPERVSAPSGNSNAAPANAQPPTNNSRNAGLPVTMPLIDAMFAEERFAQDAKAAAQMND